jgi:tetratricopeptide (TPR) repeat protein
MSTEVDTLPKGLVAGVLVLALAVLGLGGAVVALKLRPEPLPQDATSRTVALWQQQVDANPEDPLLQTGLGLALVAAGRDDEAKTAFEAAIALDDTAWLPKFRLGLLVKDDDPARALELIGDGAKLAPDEDKAAPFVAKADLLMAQGDTEGAIVAYRRSIVYSPFVFEAHYGLGKAYEAVGKDKAARKQYREALRFDPNNQEVADAIERVSG